MVSLVNNRKVTKTLLKYQVPSTCHCIIPCLVLMKTFWQIASGGESIHFSLEFESGYSPQWWRGHGTKQPRVQNRMLTSPFILTQEIEGEEGGNEERRETGTEKAQECRKYSWVRKPQHLPQWETSLSNTSPLKAERPCHHARINCSNIWNYEEHFSFKPP